MAENLSTHPLFFDNPIADNDKEFVHEESLHSKFDKERLERKDQIHALSQRIRDINGIHELQVDVYSVRQDLLERYHYLFTLLAKQNALIRKKKKKRYDYYDNEYQRSTSPKEREDLIKADLETEYEVQSELENQMKYISGTMSTVDNIIYGIKYRIEVEEYRRRM